MLSTDEFLLLNPNQIILEVSSQDVEQAWLTNDEPLTHVERWNTYLNNLCLNPILSWLEEESGITPQVFLGLTETQKLWQIINGTAITLNQTRIVIIPSEAIDTEEFRIPQEWIDIPHWTADYYLAVQVSPDHEYLRIWGYATHQQIKTLGVYDEFDRTYSLEKADVIEDLNVMWVAWQLCPHEKTEVASLPILSATEAEKFLTQNNLNNLNLLRLNLPFEQWGSLLVQDSYRQQLWHKSQQENTSNEVETTRARTLTNLSNWFGNLFEAGWQTIEEFMGNSESNLAFAFRNVSSTSEETIQNLIEQIYNNADEGLRKVAAERLGAIGNNNPEIIAALTHLIRTTEDEETRWAAAESLWTIDPQNPVSGIRRVADLGLQIRVHAVALMVAILPKSEEKVAILLRVYPLRNQTYLPSGLRLIVLDEEGDIFLETEARDADNFIQLKLGGDRHEPFIVKVALGEIEITENFVI